jgi:dCMP deaminase
MNWDRYFLKVCKAIASNSKCYSRKIGAIIVRDKSIISTGYNGPPRGVPPCNERYQKELDGSLCTVLEKSKTTGYQDFGDMCPRKLLGFESGQGLEWCIAGHAERNAIVNAAREGVSVKGCIMYMDCPVPCSPCLVEIINAGISEIVITEFTHYDRMSEYLIKYSGLKARTYE